MAFLKKYFAAFKHIAPSDMEFFLEEMASNGYILEPFSQSGLLYLKFSESRGEYVRYVVDVTGLQKHLYMKTLIDQGWEYMGQTLNCHIWKKAYEKGDRPADFADVRCIRTHCIRMGVVFAVLAILMLALFAGYIFLIYNEHAHAMEVKHDVLYALLACIQVPFTAFFAFLAYKLFKEAGKKKESLDRDLEFRKKKEAADKAAAAEQDLDDYIEQEEDI